MQNALADAVSTVNAHAGETRVRLRFSDDPDELDFVANSAMMRNNAFEFQAGFATYGGSVEEISEIRAEIIGR